MSSPRHALVAAGCLGGLALLTALARRPDPGRIDQELSETVARMARRRAPLAVARTVGCSTWQCLVIGTPVRRPADDVSATDGDFCCRHGWAEA
jgi:hypothetical protein